MDQGLKTQLICGLSHPDIGKGKILPGYILQILPEDSIAK
jgi:hypothetical protein